MATSVNGAGTDVLTIVKRYAFVPLLFLACWVVSTATVGDGNSFAGAVTGAVATLVLAARIGKRRKSRGW